MKISMQIILIFIISLSLRKEAGGLIFLEEHCKAGNPKDLLLIVPRPSKLDVSYTESLQVTREITYSTGLNCSLKINCTDPEFDIIISIREIHFRPGCKDYLKISNGKRNVGLCGTKGKHGSNMQFIGQTIYLHYFTEEAETGLSGQGFSGFSLYFTASTKYCLGMQCFRCANDYYINNRFACDGINHCGDFSDESHCSSFGLVTNIAMFLATVVGVVGGFCIGLLVESIWVHVLPRISFEIIRLCSSIRSGNSFFPCYSNETEDT